MPGGWSTLLLAVLLPAPFARAAELRICTQNLFNWGLPDEVQRLRRPEAPLEQVRRDLDRQQADLVERLSGCDVAAVQEIVGETQTAARAGLARLTDALAKATGARWDTWTAESTDVIRNGFLVRTGGLLTVAAFDGSPHPLPEVAGFGAVRWTRAPAEIELLWSRSGAGKGRPTTPVSRLKSSPAREKEPSGLARRTPPPAAGSPANAPATSERKALTLRLVTAHLKSRRGGENDPFGESFERLRVVQAAGLEERARARLAQDGGAILLILGDMNGGRGTATQLVLAGALDPSRLLRPRDCIGADGTPTCGPPLRPPLLENLLADDPDLAGRGSYRLGRREDLVDVILASPEAARLALEPGKTRDWDVSLSGRWRRGSDHLMGRVTLRAP